MTIRKAVISDVESIVDINIKTWQTTYKGIISDEVLSKLDETRDLKVERSRINFDKIEVEGVKVHQIVAVIDEKVVGFASYGKCRDESKFNLEQTGEIYGLYILKAFQGRNIGRLLVQHAMQQLFELEGYDKLLIWTLKENQSRGFYERMGGLLQYEKDITIGDQTLKEVGYLFHENALIG